MRKPTQSRDRSRTRRGSAATPKTPAPAHLRRTAAKLHPEERKAPRQQRIYRAAMTREVHNDLAGVLRTPNRARPRVQSPDPITRAGVVTPSPTPKRQRQNVPLSVKKPEPKAMVEKSVAQPLAERTNCKSRPRATAGSGNSRPFVPWCGKK